VVSGEDGDRADGGVMASTVVIVEGPNWPVVVYTKVVVNGEAIGVVVPLAWGGREGAVRDSIVLIVDGPDGPVVV
jgi:hypothetical protein